MEKKQSVKKADNESRNDLEEYENDVMDAKATLEVVNESNDDFLNDPLLDEATIKEQPQINRRISKIIVNKLFGIYDYVIDFDYQYSILHSMNGKGKTTILKLIKAVIELDFFVLDTTPFELFSISFTNDATIRVTKKDLNYSLLNDVLPKKIRRRWINDEEVLRKIKANQTSNREELKTNLMLVLDEKNKEPVNILFEEDAEFIDLLYTTYNKYYNPQETENIEPEDIKDQINASLKRTQGWYFARRKIAEITKDLECTFIEANRVKLPRHIRNTYSREFESDEHIEQCAAKLYEILQGTRMDYFRVTEHLNMTFPQRAIEAMAKRRKSTNKSNLIKQMEDLDKERKDYEQYGLLPSDNDSVRDTIIKNLPEDCSQGMLAMLTVYVEDYKSRLRTVKKTYDDIKLFLRIINDEHKFADKKLVISNYQGKLRSKQFVLFEGINGSEIKLRQLSSGEKNDFILFFEMIFGTNNNTLLLMDEPEISTHISWQMLFSKEVAKICEQTGMQIIVATHSPNIVRGFDNHVIILGEVE